MIGLIFSVYLTIVLTHIVNINVISTTGEMQNNMFSYGLRQLALAPMYVAVIIYEILVSLYYNIPKMVNKIIEYIPKLVDKIIELGRRFFKWVWNDIICYGLNKIVDFVYPFFKWAYDLGIEILESLLRVLVETSDLLYQFFKSMVIRVVDYVKWVYNIVLGSIVENFC